ERFWRESVHKGVVDGTAERYVDASIETAFLQDLPPLEERDGIEITFRADPTIHDGKYSNIGWQQELPKPLTKLVWDNAVLLSPNTAAALSLSRGQLARVQINDREIEAPGLIVP